MHPMIQFNNLHRYFGATRAVSGISFEVEPGQVFGYIGPNGAGKTTSMRILATLDIPTQGDAYVDGFSVVDDPDRVRHRLGFMPDFFGTYANVNVREYLDFFARSYNLRGQQRLTAIDRTMRFTQLDELAEKPINGLSKGMKQRLCLGRTLIHDPAVLVLDEPAAGLDPRARIELRQIIRRLADEGKTVLISSHILTELAEMCDAVGIIERGQLLAVGTVDEIQKAQPGCNAVRLRVLGDAEGVAEWLQQRIVMHQYRIDGQLLIFTHDGDRESEADLLRDLILAGFRIVEFGSERRSLEDIFMQVTKGQVQ